MNILRSVTMAGVATATIVVAAAGTASAGNWNGGGNGYWKYHDHRPHVIYRERNDTGGAIVAGAFLGLALGALASQPPPPPQPYVYEPYAYEPALPPPHPAYNVAAVADQHVAWCSQNYRSYNAERDTFIDFEGYERPCVTPFE